MGVSRIIAGILTLALLGFMPNTSSSAAASTANSASPAAGSTAQAQTPRKVFTKIVKNKHGHLIMKGYVKPPKGPVTIQKATKCNKRSHECNFKRYRRVQLRHRHYHTRVTAPRRGNWYWRAKVGHIHSDIWKTFKQ